MAVCWHRSPPQRSAQETVAEAVLKHTTTAPPFGMAEQLPRNEGTVGHYSSMGTYCQAPPHLLPAPPCACQCWGCSDGGLWQVRIAEFDEAAVSQQRVPNPQRTALFVELQVGAACTAVSEVPLHVCRGV